LLWRNRRQALALLTGSPGKGSLTPCDTFTIPRRRRKQRVVSTLRENIATIRFRVKDAPSFLTCKHSGAPHPSTVIPGTAQRRTRNPDDITISAAALDFGFALAREPE
jgi:hypothetical protein